MLITGDRTSAFVFRNPVFSTMGTFAVVFAETSVTYRAIRQGVFGTSAVGQLDVWIPLRKCHRGGHTVFVYMERYELTILVQEQPCDSIKLGRQLALEEGYCLSQSAILDIWDSESLQRQGGRILSGVPRGMSQFA